jgi:hypothetical protein
MSSHFVDDAISRSLFKPPQQPSDSEVASISAKIGETLEQFDAQLLAAEREVQTLRAGGGDPSAACHSTSCEALSDGRDRGDELASSRPAECTVIGEYSVSSSVEEVFFEQVGNGAPAD